MEGTGFSRSPEGFRRSLHAAGGRQSPARSQVPRCLLHPPTYHKEPHVPLPGVVRDRGLAMGEGLPERPLQGPPLRPWASGPRHTCQASPSPTRNALPKLCLMRVIFSQPAHQTKTKNKATSPASPSAAPALLSHHGSSSPRTIPLLPCGSPGVGRARGPRCGGSGLPHHRGRGPEHRVCIN